jgi:hypothetical protein
MVLLEDNFIRLVQGQHREFNARRPTKVLPFSPEQRSARRLFVQEYVIWNLE